MPVTHSLHSATTSLQAILQLQAESGPAAAATRLLADEIGGPDRQCCCAICAYLRGEALTPRQRQQLRDYLEDGPFRYVLRYARSLGGFPSWAAWLQPACGMHRGCRWRVAGGACPTPCLRSTHATCRAFQLTLAGISRWCTSALALPHALSLAPPYLPHVAVAEEVIPSSVVLSTGVLGDPARYLPASLPQLRDGMLCPGAQRSTHAEAAAEQGGAYQPPAQRSLPADLPALIAACVQDWATKRQKS